MRTISLLFVAAVAGYAQNPQPTGIVNTGAISLIRAEGKVSLGPLGTIESTTDVAAGGFLSTDYSKITATQQQLTTIGPCVVSVLQLPLPTTTPVSASTPLDAGPVLNLSGPNGTKQIPAVKSAFGAVVGGGTALPIPGAPAPPPLYLDPGVYTIDNGAGGADIGPFKATLTAPAQIVWTNADADVSVDRSVGVDVAWTGGDPGSKVTITGTSTVIDKASFQVTAGGTFFCSVDNTGDYFVTPDVLSILPASDPTATVPTSTLSVSSGVSTNFDATGSSTSLFLFTSGASRSVTYK